MRFTEKEHRFFYEKLNPYLKNEVAVKMKDYIQHGNTSTYEHCHNVAKLSFWLNRRLKLRADEHTLLPAAFLHDLYLYDWHIPGPRNNLHGYTHASIAMDNARKHFKISKKVESVIWSHMWPLNITRVPKTREAWIVCLADKAISTKEIITDRNTKDSGKIFLNVCKNIFKSLAKK